MDTCCCCTYVRGGEVGVLERLGEYSGIALPGLQCIMFPIVQLASQISLRIQMLDVSCDTKTLDNVFCNVKVSVMYRVLKDRVVDANYKLSDVRSQIRAYVNNVVRSTLPKMLLDDGFKDKDNVAKDVQSHLSDIMKEYGYEIINVLVIDLEPDKVVKHSMNEINASQRMRMAAAEKAEANKIMQVKAAEAEADAKYLSGQGVARQRKAVVDGLLSTVTDYKTEVAGASGTDVIDLMLMTNYFDTMKDMAHKNKNISLFLNHEPGAVADLRGSLDKNFMPGLKKGA